MPEIERPVGIVAHLVVNGAAEAINFYKRAFGAEEIMRMPEEGGTRLMHAEIRIGPSVVYLADDFPEYCGGEGRAPQALGGTPVTLHQYVRGWDAATKRAGDAGATVTMRAQGLVGGDRYGPGK